MIRIRTPFFTKLISLMAVGILCSACTTDDVATAQKPKPQVEEKISATITKGMPKEDVVNLIGEPDSVETMKASDGGQVEFWRYKRIIGHQEEFRVIGAEMVEEWSPSLGMFIEVPMEIEELVDTTITQHVEIVMHQDKVLTFKADLSQDMSVRE